MKRIPGGSVTDTGTFYGILVFFLVTTVLMFSAGLGGDPTASFGAAADPGSTVEEKQEKDQGSTPLSFSDKLIRCGASFLVGGFNGLVVGCPILNGVFEFVGGVITTLVNYFGFVFKLLTLQFSDSIPSILVVFVYYPCVIMVTWLGFSRIRGVSS